MSLSYFSQIKILTYEKLSSTNDFAMQRLKDREAENGDIIVAKFQGKGRGQVDNSWFSSEGNNILVSFVCKNIQLEVSQLPLLNMLVSLAVYKVVNRFFPGITKLKWPNDVLVKEQKIAGVLIETNLQGNVIKNAVIGIGININEEAFPPYISNACSFYSVSGRYYDLDNILNIMIEELDNHLSKLKQVTFALVKQEYESVLFGIGRKRYFRSGNIHFEGIIKGINSQGQLCVEVDEELKTYSNKEIAFDFGKH